MKFSLLDSWGEVGVAIKLRVCWGVSSGSLLLLEKGGNNGDMFRTEWSESKHNDGIFIDGSAPIPPISNILGEEGVDESTAAPIEGAPNRSGVM